jgi:hypothetical protein
MCMKVRYDKLAIYPNAIQTGCDTMFDHKADTFCRYTKVNNKQHELINQLVAFMWILLLTRMTCRIGNSGIIFN